MVINASCSPAVNNCDDYSFVNCTSITVSCLAVLIRKCLSGSFHQSNPETMEIRSGVIKKTELRKSWHFNKGILNKHHSCRPVIHCNLRTYRWFHFLKWHWNSTRTKIIHDMKATKTRQMHGRNKCSMLLRIFPQRQKEIKLSLKLFAVKQLLSGCRSNLDHLKDDFHSAAIWYSNCENKCPHTQGSERRPLNPGHHPLLPATSTMTLAKTKGNNYCQPSSSKPQQVCVCVHVGWINRPVLCFIGNLYSICLQIKTTY